MKIALILFLASLASFALGIVFIKFSLMQRLKYIRFKMVYILVLVCFMATLGLGIVIGKLINPSKNVEYTGTNKPKISFSFTKETPAVKSKQLFVLCDFESENDLRKWEASNANISLSEEFVTSGKHSAKFVYSGSVQNSKVSIEKYFYRDKKFGDWQGYNYLLFDIYTTEDKSQKIALKIRDEKGGTFSRDIFMPSKNKYTAKIFLAEVKASVDIRLIRQLNLFRWKPKKESVFYIDNLRLGNESVTGEVDATETPATDTSEQPILQNSPSPDDPETRISPPNKQAARLEPNIAKVTEKKKLIYLLKPNLEKWRLNKGNPQPSNITQFSAYISDPVNIGRISFPATGGIPFAEGELKSIENIRVVNKEGAIIPSQVKPTARWPDGSIKWLLLDLQTDVSAQEDSQIFLEYGPDIKNDIRASPLKITQDENALLVSTGPLKATMNKRKFDLAGEVYWDKNGDGNFSPEELVLNSGDMYLVHKNEKYFASLDAQPEMTVETDGRERIGIKRSGWFVSAQGKKFCKFIFRIEAFKGKPYLRLYHTFIYTGYPENKFYERYQGLKLPQNETIQEIGILVPQNIKGPAKYVFGFDQQIYSQGLTGDISLFQKQYNSFSLNTGKNINILNGNQFNGWIDLKGENVAIATALRYCWEQFPKGFNISADKKVLDIKLWPANAGELDLKTTQDALGPDSVARGNAFGLAKTHELYFYFHKPDMEDKLINLSAQALVNPLLIRPDPQWLASTTVLGGIKQYERGKYYNAEMSLNDLFDWAYRQPKAFNWYGMIDFGDTLSWYRKEAYDKNYDFWGWHPEGRWGWFNCEGVGTHSGALIQYLRTGKQKYFEFGENLARHIMDVDTCHYNTIANDPRLTGIMDDEVSQVGSMHRHNGNHWGDRNEETTHTNIVGILLYYYLTGYERAFEVAKETGSFYLKEPITYTRHPDIAPQRAISNVLWGEVFLYEATQDERYKKAADKWTKILVDGQYEDGSWADTYNPLDKRWIGKPSHLFMTCYTIPALIQYHILTKDEAVGNAIIKATDYLMANDKFKAYYDGLAYSFWLTGDNKYRLFLEGYLAQFVHWRNEENNDDLHRGMIFDKLYYQRPDEFLYNVPFSFAALAYTSEETKVREETAQPQAKEIKKDIEQGITYFTSVVSTLNKVFPDSYNLLNNQSAINLSLARNEYESVQVVLSGANKKVEGITVTWTDLKNKSNSAKIAKENIECRIVEYVKTKKPDYEVERVGFWPDPLTENRTIDLQANSLQPLWITFYAPKDISAGDYEGKLIITPANAKEQEIQISIRVFDFTLPNSPSFKTAFDLYASRMRIVYTQLHQEDAERYNQRILDIMYKYYRDMLKFKISPIMNLNYPSLSFDKKLQGYLDKGISAFSIGRYGGSFGNNWPKDKDGLASLIDYYRNFAQHLRDKGWLEKAYIYTFDEPQFGNEVVSEVAAMIHRADPQLKNLVCLKDMQDPRLYAQWVKDIDIFTIRNWGFDYDLTKVYRQMGKEVWIYVSGPKPPFANLAIDFPAMSYRILPWMGWKFGASGLLYWCANFWNEDPWKDPMNTKWKQNGNGFLFYPSPEGPVPTLRLYVLRDGIEDYDYFEILSQKLNALKQKNLEAGNQDLVNKARRLLKINDAIVGSMAEYSKDPQVIYGRRNEVAKAIEDLNKLLGSQL